jgi:hydroxymethylglutaryl-CoA lyase
MISQSRPREKPTIRIVEVGPRDGLQNEKTPIPTVEKIALITALADCGLQAIEATAFVSPRWVPQMADHDTVMRDAPRRSGLVLSALVPNEAGAKAALAAGAQELAVFASASESFAQKNTNCSIAESLARFEPVMALASAHAIPVRGYISCSVHCPYEGAIHPDAVARVAVALQVLGCREMAISDTIGTAHPEEILRVLQTVLRDLEPSQLAGHYHDTNGRALANVKASMDMGLRVFDAAAGGLGGCPYAPGAAGNLRTGHLVSFLVEQGYETPIDSQRLADVERHILEWKSGHSAQLIA